MARRVPARPAAPPPGDRRGAPPPPRGVPVCGRGRPAAPRCCRGARRIRERAPVPEPGSEGGPEARGHGNGQPLRGKRRDAGGALSAERGAPSGAARRGVEHCGDAEVPRGCWDVVARR